MKRVHVRFLYCFLVLVLLTKKNHAQKQDEGYKKQADEIRQEIWKSESEAFKNYSIPEKYKNYSKVIIARENSIKAVGTKKFKFFVITAGTIRTLTYTSTFHELVKINDESALHEYQEVKFIRSLKESSLFAKESLTTFIGVRIIKPNGSIKEVDLDEAVLTRNDNNAKFGKLAIPDLAIGDIVDYFIQTVEFSNIDTSLDPSTFVLGSSSPILNYDLNIEANNKFAVVYRTLNNAPELSISRTDDGGTLLKANLKNIQPYPVDLWMSVTRQIPIIRLQLIMNNYSIQGNIKGFKPGEVYKNLPPEKTTELYKQWINGPVSITHARNQYESMIRNNYYNYADKNNLSKKDDNELAWYYALRYALYFEVDRDAKEIEVSNRRNYYMSKNNFFLHSLDAILCKKKPMSKYIVACSKFSYNLGDVFDKDELNLFVKTNDAIFSDEGIYSSPNYISPASEGEKGFVLKYTKTNVSFSYANAAGISFYEEEAFKPISYSAAKQNQEKNELAVTFDLLKPEQIHINRTSALTGYFKHAEQKRLLLYEDELNAERENLGYRKTFLKDLQDGSRKSKQLAEEYTNAFAKARKEQLRFFEEEIQSKFDSKPENVKNNQIVQSGRFHDKPEFIYASEFDLNGLVKKAGNNFIIDIGKLIGTQLKLTAQQKERTVDVYMPCARSYQNTIKFTIPEGFTAEGIDKLNFALHNNTGVFTAKATIENNTVIIDVYKEYSNPNEKAAKWDELTAVIDTANQFVSTKLLLKKK